VPPSCGTAAIIVTRNRFQTTVDVTLAAIALVAAMPLLMLVSAVVSIESRGPVLLRCQARERRKMRVDIITFRVAHQQSPGALTRNGRVLRYTGIETLPALWNVVSGEITLGAALTICCT
jgi:lipopolysaccharide/colanic/teichoic acid biosynthesis glycosyltransferase